MDDRPKIFPPDPNETRRWMGRLLIAVILGEAIWNFIVSLMNYVVVPWLGDVLGQSSGLPTSFTQRPYDYPDLFISIIELCLAGLVAVGINAFFQRPQRVKVRVQKRGMAPVVVPAVLPTQVIPATPPRQVEQRPVVAPQPSQPAPIAAAPIATQVAAPRPPVVEPRPAPMTQPNPAPALTSRPVSPPPPPPAPPKPVPPPVIEVNREVNRASATPTPAPVKAAAPPPAPKKPKKVYYNSVGDPIEFDDED